MQAKIKEVKCENSTPLLPVYNVLSPKISAVTYSWDVVCLFFFFFEMLYFDANYQHQIAKDCDYNLYLLVSSKTAHGFLALTSFC